MIRKRHSEPPPALHQSRLGRYDIIYPLASGGMASVYVGRLSGIARFEKLVTLKLIHAHLSNQQEFVEMFLDEARLAAQIHHPNVGEIYEIVDDHGQLFIAGEFVEGRSLRHLLQASYQQNKRITCATAAWICAEICQGLQFAHDLTDDGVPLNIVHRDLSPSNILLSYGGWVKLIDFGVAYAENRLAHTLPENIKGKIGYISPEQLDGATLDRRSDIFSLGVILYLATTGKHPFPGKSKSERFRKTLTCDLILPSKISSWVDKDIERIILKALSVSPAHRFQSAMEMEAVLRQYIASAKEIAGAVTLGPLMQELFGNEMKQHQQNVSEFHRRVNDAQQEILEGDNVVYLSRSMEPMKKISTTVLCRPSAQQLRASRRTGSRVGIVGGIIAAVALAVAAGVFWWTHFDSVSLTTEKITVSSQLKPSSQTNTKSGENEYRNETGGNSAITGGESTLASVAASELVKIPVSLSPANAQIMLGKKRMPVEENAIYLPDNSESVAVTVSAEGYIPQTHALTIQPGESLVVSLSPVSVSLPQYSTPEQTGASALPSLTSKRKLQNHPDENQAQHVLKRNPY